MVKMKTPRGISESSTTSDNTTEFIDIVKKYDVVYNTHNPDYKNVEVKLKVWSQIGDEIGLSVDASKRKWKNLRDSYTKYLRSFRIGSKTSKKYQFWAHAEHMDFLKPFQGPGRNVNSSEKIKSNHEDEDTECDLGYQVLAKASTSSEDDLKVALTSNGETQSNALLSSSLSCSTSAAVQAIATIPPTLNSNIITPAATTISPNTSLNLPLALTSNSSLTATSNMPPVSAAAAAAAAAALALLPMPSLPTVQLPPQLTNKPLMTPLATSLFPLPQLSSTGKPTALPISCSTAASSVGCLIIEPQLFASADTFKKELGAPTLGMVNSIMSQATATAPSSRINPPLISKIRRVQPSPQTAAINLSFSANSNTNTNFNSNLNNSNFNSNSNSSSSNHPPATKIRKIQNERNQGEFDIAAVLEANRELDANTLFFLSLARTVRSMPTRFQSIAKMRCMRIVSDIELELENVENGIDEQATTTAAAAAAATTTTNGTRKYAGVDSPSPPATNAPAQNNHMNESATEHFFYIMSPSRVESMIDLSSDEDATLNGG